MLVIVFQMSFHIIVGQKSCEILTFWYWCPSMFNGITFILRPISRQFVMNFKVFVWPLFMSSGRPTVAMQSFSSWRRAKSVWYRLFFVVFLVGDVDPGDGRPCLDVGLYCPRSESSASTAPAWWFYTGSSFYTGQCDYTLCEIAC